MQLRSSLKYLLAVIVAVLAPRLALAQNDVQFTQYWAAPNYYNPAAIGMTDYIHVLGGSRLQWVGVENAPVTFTALADMPFKLGSKRLAVGVNLMQESLGLYKTVNASAQIAYKKKMLGGVLSIGGQVGIINETFKGSETYIPDGDDYHQSNDQAIPQNDVAGTAFDAAAGIHFTHKWFWVAVSGSHLNAPVVTMKTESSEESEFEFRTKRTYYFMGGSNIPVKNTLLEVQPSVLVKTDIDQFQAEATARVRYNKMFSAGVGYRWNDAVSLMLGVEIKNFFLGYSYDYATSAIMKASSGSHEVFVSYNVKLDLSEKNKNKHRSIRIM